MSLEAIAYLLAAIPVVHKWLKTHAAIAESAAHAISQNTEILGRQTAILEALAPLVHDLSERVAALEVDDEEEDLEPAIGFTVERDEEEDEEEPANSAPRKRR